MPEPACVRSCRVLAVALALGTAITLTVLTGTGGPALAQPSDETVTVTETATVTETTTITVPTTVTETTTVTVPTTVTETTTITEPTTVTETTTVTTSVTPTASEPSGGWELVLLLALMCGVLLSAGLLIRANRHRRVGWVKAHVAVKPRHGPGATFETRPGDGVNRDHVISVVPVETGRSTTLEENL
jgi:hypothetical protein